MRIEKFNGEGTKTRWFVDMPGILWLRDLLISPFIYSIVVLALFLSSCGPAPTPVPTVTSTVSPLPSLTPTATATPIPTPTQTPTPEPAWYQPLDPSLGVLKYNYAQVNNPKARVYTSLQDAVAKTGNFGYLPNFPAYVAYSTTVTRDGRTFDLIPVSYGWMDGADLQALTPSSFAGFQLTREVPFRFGWVLTETQSVNAAGTPIQTYERYQIVHEAPAVTENPGYIAIGADEWLPEDNVALVSPQVPADAGANTCRFIYANLGEQTLTVYDKCKLVFATLISSGKNSWTFEGRFTILYKIPYDVINSPDWSTSEYYIQGVPNFMSYSNDFGFHGAYWHDNFGIAASHGCINLSPADSKWLYDWAGLGERVIISGGNK